MSLAFQMNIDLLRHNAHDTSRLSCHVAVAISETDVTPGYSYSYKGANTVTEELSLPSKGSLKRRLQLKKTKERGLIMVLRQCLACNILVGKHKKVTRELQ